MQLRLSDWVFSFVHAFRYESGKLKLYETECFEPYVKEQMLTGPCQAEVIQFVRPYRLAMFFFFDKTKQDLLIHICQEKWNNIAGITAKLLKEYYSLKLVYRDLHKLLKRCRSYPKGSIYAIDWVKGVCLIAFVHDPRVKASPFPWDLSYISEPQKMADLVFGLNFCQALDEFANR